MKNIDFMPAIYSEPLNMLLIGQLLKATHHSSNHYITELYSETGIKTLTKKTATLHKIYTKLINSAIFVIIASYATRAKCGVSE